MARSVNACAGCPNCKETIHPTGPGHLRRRRAGDPGAGQPGAAPADPDEDARRKRIPEPLRHPRALQVPRASIRIIFYVNGQEHRVDYLPAESNTGMFGGNSNWRGPIWMPVNVLIIRALLNFYLYYGDNFKIECPTGSGKMMNLFEVAKEIADRLARIFLRDEDGRRPVYGGTREVPDRSALARSHPLLRILPRRQRRRAGRQPPDRMDRARGQDDPALRPAGFARALETGQDGRIRPGSAGSSTEKRTPEFAKATK